MSEQNSFNSNNKFFKRLSEPEGSGQELGHFLLDESGHFSGFENRESASERYDSNRLRSESIHERVTCVKVSPSPLLEAARPLLRALSEMPEKVKGKDEANLLREALKKEITLFSVVCDEADISWKKMAIVRYCLCTALDEAALALPWSQEVNWSQSNLLNHFEGDNDGGIKFFLLVGRLSMSPQEYADVLEIQLIILGLGFEGRYSIVENGERQLNRIRQRLLTLLQSSGKDRGAVLSPDAIPVRSEKTHFQFYIPVRISALVAALVIVGSFIYARYHLMIPQIDVIARIDAAARMPVTLPPPPVIPKLKLAELLKDAIASDLVSVEDRPHRSLVTFRGDGMFKTGSTEVTEEMQVVLKRVGGEIQRVNGKVIIVGFTDAIPIRRPDIPNNQVLSEKRAASVARLLQQAGVPADLISSEGRGDGNPIATNATVEGRAQNRRVELSVNY